MKEPQPRKSQGKGAAPPSQPASPQKPAGSGTPAQAQAPQGLGAPASAAPRASMLAVPTGEGNPTINVLQAPAAPSGKRASLMQQAKEAGAGYAQSARLGETPPAPKPMVVALQGKDSDSSAPKK